MTRSAPYEKSKCLGSGGSMVARLKLKEIDGRAPPGVKKAAALRPKAAREGWWLPTNASLFPPGSGDTPKLRETREA